jgi:predicted tellurium resistance membrane protein TerC
MRLSKYLGAVVEYLSTEFFSALAAIVVIDLVLAGDNAIVIALAARSLPCGALPARSGCAA